MTTITRRWDDVGALSLTGQVGSGCALFKSALSAAGWSVEFEDLVNHKLVMKNDPLAGGNEAWVRFEESAQEILMQCYESMSDIDTGTGNATALNSGGGVVIRKSEAASSATRPYVIVADALRFYGGTYSNGTAPPTPTTNQTSGAYTTAFGAGAPDALIPGDPSVFVAGRDATGTQFVRSGLAINWPANTGPTSDLGFSLSRDASLSASPTPVALLPVGLETGPTAATGFGNNSYLVGSTPPGFSGHLCVPALVVGSNTFRGRMPGLFVPVNNCQGVTHLGDTVTPVGTSSPKAMAVIAGYAGTTAATNQPSRLFVDTGEW